MQTKLSIRLMSLKRVLLVLGCILSTDFTWALSPIYVFGDSLSDKGNLFELTGLPPDPPYFNGRFSNGPLWSEYLVTELGGNQEDLISFAWGGALTDEHNLNDDLPGLKTQINAYINSESPLKADAVHIIWAGPNDFMAADFSQVDPLIVAEQAVSHIHDAAQQLLDYGVDNLLVINMPDLGKVPYVLKQEHTVQLLLSQLTQYFNSRLRESVQPLNVIYVDIANPFSHVIEHKDDYNLINVTEACFDKTSGEICSQPQHYFFWDGLHPTTRIHQLIATIIADILNPLLVTFSQPFTAQYLDSGIALNWEIADCERSTSAEIQLWRAQRPTVESSCPRDVSRYHPDSVALLTPMPQIDSQGTLDSCYGLRIIEYNGEENWYFAAVER